MAPDHGEPRLGRGLIAAIAAVAVFAVTLGASYPLLAIILDRAGQSESYIGLSAAMVPLGILVSAPVIPWTASRVSSAWLASASACLTAILLGSLAVLPDPDWWFPIRFMLGCAVNTLFVLSETWINQLATPHRRGRIMGVYATVISLGFAAGPVIVALTGTDGLAAFAIAAAGALAAAAMFSWTRHDLPQFHPTTEGNLWTFARTAPVLLICAGTVALFDQTTLSLTPIYALRIGFDETAATIATGTLVAGNVVTQIPIGYLADIWPRRLLMALLASIVIVGCVVLPLTGGGILFWPVLFILGGAGYGIYTVTLAELGTRFSGAMLLAGNAAFSLMWGIGGTAGPAAAGTLMDQFGPAALPWMLAGLFVALVVMIGWRALQRAGAPGT